MTHPQQMAAVGIFTMIWCGMWGMSAPGATLLGLIVGLVYGVFTEDL